MQVSKVSSKAFFGKDLIYAAVWKKGDKRTTYNVVYLDGATGRSMVKRFNVTSITRDCEYPITKGTPKSKSCLQPIPMGELKWSQSSCALKPD